MMKTPIDDFVRAYAEGGTARLHMPGHKGVGDIEACDITEIRGADSLFEASGIIRKSEENAARLFGARTLYSTEGSSLCIRAMLYLLAQEAKACGRAPVVLSARSSHKTLVGACALLGLDVDFLYPCEGEGYLSCTVTPEAVKEYLSAHEPPTAVYLTSPDYLGHRQDIRAIAEVCHAFGTRLAVDNAHGAYLAFLSPSEHPIALGADMCCDSAHKTLPVLTGGAYLHLHPTLAADIADGARDAMALFASTSPSYLTLASLDRANRTLAENFSVRLEACCTAVAELRAKLIAHGYALTGDEPMKLTLCPKSYGYTGTELADALRRRGIECEFSDPDYTVLMPSVNTPAEELAHLSDALCSLPRRVPILTAPPKFHAPTRVMSLREAVLSPSEVLPVSACLGRTVSTVTVGCPPAVPILVSGEQVDAHATALFAYYGIETLRVVRA